MLLIPAAAPSGRHGWATTADDHEYWPKRGMPWEGLPYNPRYFLEWPYYGVGCLWGGHGSAPKGWFRLALGDMA